MILWVSGDKKNTLLPNIAWFKIKKMLILMVLNIIGTDH